LTRDALAGVFSAREYASPAGRLAIIFEPLAEELEPRAVFDSWSAEPGDPASEKSASDEPVSDVSVSDERGPGDGADSAARFSLGLVWGRRLSFASLDGSELVSLLPQARGLDARRLPDELKLAFLDLVVQPVLDDLSAFLGEEVFFKTLSADDKPTGGLLKFSLSVKGANGSLVTGIHLAPGQADNWRALFERLSRRPKNAPFDPEALTLPMTVACGGVHLSIAELASLAPGDVLFSDPPIRPDRFHLEYGGQLRAVLEAEGRTARLITSLTKETQVPPDQDSPDGSPGEARFVPDASDSIETLEVPLRFEVGRLNLTIRELRALAPGSTFPLPDPENEVTVTCHGQKLAAGRLVDLEGRLGVELTKIDRGLSLLAGSPKPASRTDQADGPGDSGGPNEPVGAFPPGAQGAPLA
jgi:type III secretion protein Q